MTLTADPVISNIAAVPQRNYSPVSLEPSEADIEQENILDERLEKVEYVCKILDSRLGDSNRARVVIDNEIIDNMNKLDLKTLINASVPSSHPFMRDLNISYKIGFRQNAS